MKYTLKPEISNDAQPIVSGDLPDKFAAETWAVKWVKDHASHDAFSLEAEDRAFRAKLLRTQGGQWYVTPAT